MGGYAELKEKEDAWTYRAVQAIQAKDPVEQDFAVNVAKGYRMKIDRILDNLVGEEICQVDVLA